MNILIDNIALSLSISRCNTHASGLPTEPNAGTGSSSSEALDQYEECVNLLTTVLITYRSALIRDIENLRQAKKAFEDADKSYASFLSTLK